jgi:hypothetical protein
VATGSVFIVMVSYAVTCHLLRKNANSLQVAVAIFQMDKKNHG